MDIKELLGFPMDQLEGRVIMGDAKATAYMWISRYTDNLNEMIRKSRDSEEYHQEEISIDDLLYHADSHQGQGWGDYIIRGAVFEGMGVDPVFWDKYAILKGIPRDEVKAESFFSCSC